MKNIFIGFIVISLGTLFSGCKKDFLTEKPQDIIVPDNLYVNKQGFESGLYGLYNLWRRERSGLDNETNQMIMTAAISAVDNAYGMRVAGGQEPDLVFNEWGTRVNSTLPYVSKLWEWLYRTINAANTLIDRSANPSITWTEQEKNQIVGEAKLIRAWAYRHLTYMFGAVPLTLTESKGSSIRTDWDRTPVAEVRKAMEKDLLDAEAGMRDLPVAEGRAGKAAAQHYLAELYLATGEFQKAKDKATLVTQNPGYKLITARYGVRATQPGTPYTDMFLDGNSNRSQGNTEALWTMQNEYQSVAGNNNILRRYWVTRYDLINVAGKTPLKFSIENGGRGLGRLGITRHGFSLYGAGDDRGSHFAFRFFYIMNNAASLPTTANANIAASCALPGYTSGATGGRVGIDSVRLTANCNEPAPGANANTAKWPSIRKWEWAPSNPADVESASQYNDQVYLRLAETYLVLAEAQLGLTDLAGAATTLNVVRARAGATPISAADVNIDFILDERSRELLTEEQRRYSLLRTRKWLERTQRFNLYTGPKITARDTLLPIPQDVIDANLTKLMPNNSGY